MLPNTGRWGDVEEIIDNLVDAGLSADDIEVDGNIGILGNDGEVTLQASREMIEALAEPREQYRTTNVVNRYVGTICIHPLVGRSWTVDKLTTLSQGLDDAIQNYNALNLVFQLRRVSKPESTCGALVSLEIVSGSSERAGFRAYGNPWDYLSIGIDFANGGRNTAEHLITHEIGHAIGMRHSDYFDRRISCGSGGNEGAGGVRAVHIAGTPAGTTVGGSSMNAAIAWVGRRGSLVPAIRRH